MPHTCTQCGGRLSADSSRCEYCGASIDTSGWTAVWTAVRQLPPHSTAHPDRSITVLGYTAAHALYISVYYDFSAGIWRSDRYQKVKGPYNGDLDVTFWASLPSAEHAAWISVSSSKPTEPDPHTAADEEPEHTIAVLTSDRSGNTEEYLSSLIIAQIDLEYGHWYSLALDDNWFSFHEREMGLSPTHWMPLPKPPVE